MDMDTVHQEILMAYAAGRLAEPVALAVATHLALNPKARGLVRGFEEIAGRFFEELEPEPLASDRLEAVMARLDEPVRHVPPPPERGRNIPRVLARHLPRAIENLDWKRMGPVAECTLLGHVSGYKTKLFRLQAGRAVPQHTHDGNELTVVLRGAYSDGVGHYCEGDLAVADGSIDHRPKADPGEDCLCLAVTDARLRLTGTFTRLLNPFVRI